MRQVPAAHVASAAPPPGHARPVRFRAVRRALAWTFLAAVLLTVALRAGRPILPAAEVATASALRELGEAPLALDGRDPALGRGLTVPGAGLLTGMWKPCAIFGGTCQCTGTLIFSTVLGEAVREVNVDGDVQCTAEALGAPAHRDLRVCWCQDGVLWGDEVRKGLAALVRQGLALRIEIASAEVEEPSCSADDDGAWHGCVTMSRRWDTTVIPQGLVRAAPPEEQLDMSLRKLDACHRLAPKAPLRVLGVRSGQSADVLEMPVGMAHVCSLVYKPDEGAMWTAQTRAHHCSSEPGTCTTTPCECRRAEDSKLELHTPQGQRCWVCAQRGKEYAFRVTALAEQMGGSGPSWWPPSGINCPPILWMFMDWRAVMSGCPVISLYMVIFFGCLMLRRLEEFSGGLIMWTRVAPLFGPALKRGEVWRFFTFTFFHLHFLDLFQNLLTLLDTLDVEGTPAIVLGDGSNLKCGVGAKQNFMCYPSIGIGSYHTLGVALVSAMIGAMSSTWITFKTVVTGAQALGFGLSGAIVALYALYAGAELDQSTTVQRSFQDWVWLRLIFVAFHIAMEWIRGVSQKDAPGLFAHTTSFVAGFAYVLYFLPPMGDGTLLPSNQPYVVPCAYDVHLGEFADSSVPECVRLFSQLYEYPVPVVQRNALLLFAASIGLTVLNTVVMQRQVPSTEAVLLGGLEVSAVCVPRKGPVGGQQQPGSNLEGKRIIFWCEIVGVSNLRVPEGAGDWEPVVEVRCLGADPRKVPGGMLAVGAEAAASTRKVQGGAAIEFKEDLFLPVTFLKVGWVQIVLWDARSGERVPLGFAAVPMSEALRLRRQDFNERQLRMQAVDSGHSVQAGRAVVRVRFRHLEVSELSLIRTGVKSRIDSDTFKIQYLEHQAVALRQMHEAAAAESGVLAAPPAS